MLTCNPQEQTSVLEVALEVWRPRERRQDMTACAHVRVVAEHSSLSAALVCYSIHFCSSPSSRSGFRILLDSGLHVADAVTEAPAARDVDDAAPLVTVEGRLATTSAETPDAARA